MSDARHCDGVHLNLDILCVVMEFVKYDGVEGIRSIAAISRTCKRMRFEGTKYLLSGTVELSFIDHIRSFCHFMLADKSARLPFLKGLVLRLYKIEDDDHVGLVCEVLRGSSNLYELGITLDAASSPLALSAIPAAIASLTSLRVFSLTEFFRYNGTSSNPKFAMTLRNARAPLISLSINIGVYTENGQTARVKYNRKRDPIFLCSRLRTTLERLEASGGLRLIVRPGPQYEYPRLKHLVLPLYDLFMPYLKPFIVSAPQLRHLQFGGKYNTHTRHRHDEDILRERIIKRTQTPQEWRTINERDQEAIGRSWPMLDSFKGAIIGAYATGLACPVAKVHLLSTGGRRTTELAMLSIVLSDWRPSFLRLSTKIYHARGYIPILPPSTGGWGESLKTLELRLNLVEDHFDFEECFNHIGQMLSALSVTSLRLEFCCLNSRMQDGEHRHPPHDPFEGDECEFDSDEPGVGCYMQDLLLQEDLPQRVRECMRSASALRRMTFVWGRCYSVDPNRVICVDLDNVPHVWDRPGNKSDEWYKLDTDW